MSARQAARITNGDLGRAIRRLRHERDLTIESLAFAADVHPTYVSGIERGVSNPTWQIVCSLARALDTPIATLAHNAETEAQLAQRIAEARTELGLPGDRLPRAPAEGP